MATERNLSNIALIGFMGCGKSSVGRLVASLLDFEFVDTDDLIETSAGCTISDIFDQSGEAAFRELEASTVQKLAARQRTVIATGGGLGANPDNLNALKSHALVVCLWASPSVIWSRVKNQSHRPLLKNEDPMARIKELLNARKPIYKQADVLINSGLRPLREVAQQVVHQFQAATQPHSSST
jgi:shikimate kinase